MDLFSGDGMLINLADEHLSLLAFLVTFICDIHFLVQMVLALLFGLAPNYYLAICIRTLWGFTNGNLGVLKTYVSEMCSEDKQSLGFSILVTMGGISK